MGDTTVLCTNRVRTCDSSTDFHHRTEPTVRAFRLHGTGSRLDTFVPVTVPLHCVHPVGKLFSSMTHFFPGDDPTLRQAVFCFVGLDRDGGHAKHYNRWIEQHRELRKQENRQKYLSLLDATFDGIATVQMVFSLRCPKGSPQCSPSLQTH